jgi:hypothetical protein
MDVGKWKISVNSFATTKFLHTILYVRGSFYFSFLRVINASNFKYFVGMLLITLGSVHSEFVFPSLVLVDDCICTFT